MLGYDKFHNLDAALLDVYYNITGTISDKALYDKQITSAAAELANKYGASPFGEWGGNFIKNYTVAIGLLAVSVFSGGAALPNALIKIYGGMSKISALRAEWIRLQEDDSLTDSDRVLQLTIFGIKNEAIDQLGKAGGAQVKNFMGKYKVSEKIKNLSEGITKLTTKSGLKENNKREDQYYF